MYGAELRWLAIFKLVTLCLSAKEGCDGASVH